MAEQLDEEIQGKSEESSETSRKIKQAHNSKGHAEDWHRGFSMHSSFSSLHLSGSTGLSQPASNVMLGSFDPILQRKIRAHEEEISSLKTQINVIGQELSEQQAESEAKEYKIKSLQQKIEQLDEKIKLSHLISRVNESAQNKLLDNSEFRSLFERQTPCPAYVMAIDIRRSTELMLKAREPKLFAEFIMGLARKLNQVILDDYGIFDKFTGDGILAFFPEFYSGEDAGFRVITAAAKCHKIFEDHYTAHRHCFISVLRDIGLGIGLDYGDIHMVQIGGDFTVVGTPVVYACRMAGSEARQTYLNEPAYEKIFEQYSAHCDFDECDIEIKHEGNTLAYRARLNGKPFHAALPDWENSVGK